MSLMQSNGLRNPQKEPTHMAQTERENAVRKEALEQEIVLILLRHMPTGIQETYLPLRISVPLCVRVCS
jgi:hypothetical protein